MLHRALASVERGFYIDIGAQHPEIDSVSQAFYERGWSGVHVEPVAGYAAMLREARTGDVVIEAAVSNEAGEVTLAVFPETGLSTVVEGVATAHVSEGGGATMREVVVPAITLAMLADEIGAREVHWLKIDVEGHEKAVLEGWDPSRLRPWICLIEATAPNSMVSNHEAWEHLLLEAEYEHVYSDGLNRFYVASEKAALLRPAFEVPPNVFDEFQLGEHVGMCRELVVRHERRLSAQRKHYEAELLDLSESHHQMVKDFTHRLHTMQLHLNAATTLEAANFAMRSSLSWRLTAPLRKLIDLLVRLKGAVSSVTSPSAPAPSCANARPTRSPATTAWLARLAQQADRADN